MSRAWWLIALVGCVDADGDGLLRSEERELGLDDTRPDTDGDGLTDLEELEEYGTDPLEPDTDGDGYLDGDEVAEGHDPNDDADRIYVGGWPYYGPKDELQGQPDDVRFEEGRRLPRLAPMPDQFGDDVDLYDFYNEQRVIVVQATTPGCGPCEDLSRWLAGEEVAAMAGHEVVRDAVMAGDVWWIQVVGPADAESALPDAAAAAAWDTSFGVVGAPVLADTTGELWGFVDPWTMPLVTVLAPDLTMYFRGDARAAAREVVTLQSKLTQ